MIRIVQRFAVVLAVVVTGCTSGVMSPTASASGPTRMTLFVCGVFGDGPWYDGVREAVAESGASVETVSWGLPKPLFVGNFSGHDVHEKAEAELAEKIDAAAGTLDLIGHSAGCGVILGALAKCHRDVGRVVLIAPSVSPGNDLSSALHRSGAVHVFFSDRDTTFLKWRCSTFGTYDAVKSPAAGYSGFAQSAANLHQYPYDPAWASLGNDGGHGGGTARDFVSKIVMPRTTPTQESLSAR